MFDSLGSPVTLIENKYIYKKYVAFDVGVFRRFRSSSVDRRFVVVGDDVARPIHANVARSR